MNIWFPTLKANSGSDVYVRELAAGLRARGHEATVTWLPLWLEPAPYFARVLSPPRGTDIIHTNSWNGFAFSRPGLPMATTVHHWVHDPVLLKYKSVLQRLYHSALIRRYERRTILAADRVFTVSDFSARVIHENFPSVSPDVIYNGIDSERFVPAPAGSDHDDTFRLLFVGSPDQRKGYDLLAPIMQRLGTGYALTCVTQRGHPPLDGDNIRCLTGIARDELLAEYQQCDAFLFPTRYEGFGYVVAEAMACGKPAVTSDCSSIPEVCADGVHGFLCPVDDVEAYVARITELRNNPALVREFGDNARRKVVAEFSVGTMVDRYVAQYAEAIESAAASEDRTE